MLVEPIHVQPIHVRRIRIYVYKAAANPPIRASFGLIKERSSLLVAIDDHDGNTGWGEVWTGLPAFGATHRAELLEKIVAPQVVGNTIDSPTEQYGRLAESLLPIVRLAGEAGPVSQVLAGLDCALWDLAARREFKPLYRLLGGQDPNISVYASGVPPHVTHSELEGLRARGFRAFKLKAGFDDGSVLPGLVNVGRALLPGESMMIDANCGWNIDQAVAAVRYLEDTPLEWVEEPLGPESPAAQWEQLAAASRHPIAAGENIMTQADFERTFAWLDVIQPDLGKWGGISNVVPLARQAMNAGVRFCPHSFGTNVGAALAAHVLAAVGGDGRLELDVNINPLRTVSSPPFMTIADGSGSLGSTPGIGIDVDLEALAPFLQRSFTVE